MGLLDVVVPQRCASCRRPGSALCTGCLARFVRIGPPVCARCGAPGAWPVERCAECAGRRLAFASARAALVYEAHARTLVGAWKERGRRDLARPAAVLVAAGVPRPAADVVTFVPGDKGRLLSRGHHPAERLAVELARVWELPAAPFLLRVRAVPRQRGLTLAERRRNVAGAFAALRPVPRRVVLVDDVYTTGSTVSACATELRRAGATRVEVVSLARAVR